MAVTPHPASRLRGDGALISREEEGVRSLRASKGKSVFQALPHLSGEQLLYINVGFFRRFEFEEAERLEQKRARDHIVGKLLDAHVVDVDGLVVELAPVGDRVLQPADSRLQLQES